MLPYTSELTLLEQFEANIQAREKSISKLEKKIAKWPNSCIVAEYKGMLKSLKAEQELCKLVVVRLQETEGTIA